MSETSRIWHRLAHGYSLAEAACRLGITPDLLKLLESGDVDPLPDKINHLYAGSRDHVKPR